ADRMAAHVLESGDIVFGRKGAVDRHLLVTPECAQWMQGSDCIRLRLSGDVLIPRYVSYAMLEEPHKKWMLAQCGNKATMASLNHDVIKRIEIFVPPVPVQREIVGVLTAYDDLIENNHRRIKLLEDAARLLYREWFVHLRFPGHEHVKVVDGVPEGWGRMALGDVLTLQRGFDLPSGARVEGEIPIFAATGVHGSHNKAMVSGPGVITGRSGSLGAVSYSPGDFWPLNTTLWIKEFKRVAPEFAYFLLSVLGLEQYNGGVAVPTLNRNDVHRIQVNLPSQALMDEFNEFALLQFRQVATLTQQTEKLRQARDLLLPRLMRGDLAV
ncbi:restriction endonuclease subunit S, partial [Dokdonella sp.]|uniref:restriction endonuclease subunit S n=1 Tax=Dokdonella sp. TaxID=2291710 RepID=UPI0025BA4E74